MWERLGCVDDIASLALVTARSLDTDDRDSLKAMVEARIAGINLGLTPAGLARLRWEIVDAPNLPVCPPAAPRRRLRVTDF